MNNNNDNKRIRDPQENVGRTVTIMHKASAASLTTLQTLLGTEKYKEDNIKLKEIDSNLVSELKLADGTTIKDAEKLREISNLDSEIIIVYADQAVGLSSAEITDLSKALKESHIIVGKLRDDVKECESKRVGLYERNLQANKDLILCRTATSDIKMQAQKAIDNEVQTRKLFISQEKRIGEVLYKLGGLLPRKNYSPAIASYVGWNVDAVNKYIDMYKSS